MVDATPPTLPVTALVGPDPLGYARNVVTSATTTKGGFMKKRSLRMFAVAVLAVLPLAATACKIDVGNGCSVLIAEPGANIGFVCN